MSALPNEAWCILTGAEVIREDVGEPSCSAVQMASVLDPQLGMLERSRGLWRGSVALCPGVIVSLALPERALTRPSALAQPAP